VFRKTIRRIKYTVLTIVGIFAMYFLLAFLLPHIKVNKDFTEDPNGITIYICSNGVHTDIAMPVKTRFIDWRTEFPPSTFKAVDSTFQYIEVGWGDKAFYLNTPTWGDLKFSTAFNALFFLDSSAIHIYYDKHAPAIEPNVCQKICINTEQYKQLIAYVQATITLHNGNPGLFPGKGYGATDNFYEANGHYSFLKTCNVWTGGALKAAGVEQGLWSPFQGGVMDGYSR